MHTTRSLQQFLERLIAFSCRGRGVCPSCNTRRMVEVAAHLVDHVFPPLPVRQWSGYPTDAFGCGSRIQRGETHSIPRSLAHAVADGIRRARMRRSI